MRPTYRAVSWTGSTAVLVIGAGACPPSLASTERPPGAGLPASALEVRAAVSVSRVSRRRGDSVVITVSARNPRWWPVRVHLGGPGFLMAADPRETRGISFAYRMEAADGGRGGPGGGVWGQPVVWFGPGMGWRRRFVVPVSTGTPGAPAGAPGQLRVDPGRYRVVGAFGTRVSAPVFVEVVP